MAGSALRRPIPGMFTRRRPARGLSAGAQLSGGSPAMHALEDTAGNEWVYWFDVNGVLRFADIATVVAASFNFNTGGKVANVDMLQATLLAASVDTDIAVATQPFIVLDVRETHSVVGGASAAVRPRKITDTSAPGAAASGTVKEITTAALDLTLSVNTQRQGALSATPADYTFAVGDRLALDFSGTLTGLVGQITVAIGYIG
jgi:hypothetical protein